jgi:hypothetical protein
VHEGPVQVLLEQALERRCHRTLRCREHGVQRVAVTALEVLDDEGRVCDDGAVIVDVGQLALGRLHHVACVHQLERQSHHAQVRLQLHAEGAGVGQAEGGGELEQLDHVTLRPE